MSPNSTPGTGRDKRFYVSQNHQLEPNALLLFAKRLQFANICFEINVTRTSLVFFALLLNFYEAKRNEYHHLIQQHVT